MVAETQPAFAQLDLKRDVRFLGPRGLQKGPVRHQLGGPMAAMSDRLAGAIPFYRSSHLIATDSLIA